ncbi:MAG: hypothetical protein QW835_04825 [Candidatus Hadarchaeum sp.]|uniref:hypothetical protein n=1 Tax=Candidatus Hadarchaeum sp. TaxID=2883567 RepID=UPI003176513C
MLEAVGYVILGVFLVLLPGFLFSIVLYPKREHLDFWSRVGTSLGLGAMMGALLGYVISIPGLSTLSLESFTLATLIVSIILAIAAFLRGGFDVLSWYKNQILCRFRKPKKETDLQSSIRGESTTG